MKKLWLVVLAAMLVSGACGNDDDGSDSDNPVIEAPVETTFVP